MSNLPSKGHPVTFWPFQSLSQIFLTDSEIKTYLSGTTTRRDNFLNRLFLNSTDVHRGSLLATLLPPNRFPPKLSLKMSSWKIWKWSNVEILILSPTKFDFKKVSRSLLAGGFLWAVSHHLQKVDYLTPLVYSQNQTNWGQSLSIHYI